VTDRTPATPPTVTADKEGDTVETVESARDRVPGV
jgi:hypothetical protein